MKIKTFHYNDLVNDDFAYNTINTVQTPADYEYIPRSVWFRAGAFVAYHLIARPITYLYIKIAFHQKYVNRKVLRSIGKKGCFFFGNHTLEAGDAFIPNHIMLRKNYIVAGPDATSIKGLGTIVKMLGAIPIPSTIRGSRKYMEAVAELVGKGKTVTIYPEAHIWPYYTKIRPFKADSFTLPVASDAPSFSFTNVFLKSKNPLRRRPVVKTYINGPFYPNASLPKKERIVDLRDRIYDSMKKEAEKQEQYVTHVYVEDKA